MDDAFEDKCSLLWLETVKKMYFSKLNWKRMFVEPLKHISAAQMFQGHGSKTTRTGETGNLRGHRSWTALGFCSDDPLPAIP